MPTALILIADGTEEIEFVTPYDVLVRAGFIVRSAGVNLKNGTHAVCSRNVRIVPDFPSLDDVAADFSADILMLPGGASGAAAFCTSQAVLQLVATSRQRGKWIAAICAGTTALVASGMDKVTVTSHPSVKNEIQDKQWNYSDSRIVVDSQVITSRGPGTALLFALTIVEELCGKDKRDEVAGPMIVAETL